MNQPQHPAPRVFISSTGEDLVVHREAAKEAAVGAEMMPVMMEYFTAAGDRPPLAACLAEVDRTDLLVVLVAHRYGWVPGDQDAGENKSITWLECERAAAAGKEVLAFVLDAAHPWPAEKREENRIAAAVLEGKATAKLLAEVKRNVQSLQQFKQWLNDRAIRAEFTTPETLQLAMFKALHGWRSRHVAFAAVTAPASPDRYLRWLRDQSSHIDIRGLQVGAQRGHRFSIEELFISLTTSGGADEDARAKRARRGEPAPDQILERTAHVELHKALHHDRLTIVGDPGAGKTTFLRRIAFALSQTRLGEVPDAAAARLEIADRTFPVLIRLGELAAHVARRHNQPDAPAADDSPGWLPDFLGSVGEDAGWGLDAAFFKQQLESDVCSVLLDGLDEAPDRVFRETLSRLIENAATAFAGCRFVVTSRPAGYTDQAILPGFAHATIDPLSDDATQTFLMRWCQALNSGSDEAAAAHCRELLTALRARPDIRRMARNPVMLTALAVVHWNERRLPEQRADLYESIVRWLSRSREQLPRRATADRAVRLLQELALAMQNHPDGMRTQVPKRWAAEALAAHFDAGVDEPDQSVDAAERFLDDEELDSGIIVGRGTNIQFWHRTFQEYLAARCLGGRTDQRQRELLWSEPKKLYLPEWREVLLLLAGVLYQQGAEKVDGLVKAALDDLGADPALPERARCVGLLGALVRDLAPFDYQPPDRRYDDLLDDVQAIFDVRRAHEVDVQQRIAAADALGQAGDPRIDPRSPDYWIHVPAGTFWMGAQKNDPKGRNYDEEADDKQSGWSEEPVHEVELDQFWIARYPVTVWQFQQFVDNDGYQDSRWWSAGGFGQFEAPEEWDEQIQYPTRPVHSVSWYEVAAFCAWMADWRPGVRLPTEAEWERAARGTTARKFPWGDEPASEQRLNYNENVGHVTPVGIYPQGNTEDGISDMAGNIWEWCADWFSNDYYAESERKNPRGPEQGEYRVLRGGAWYDLSHLCRAAVRNWVQPVNRDYGVGFRVLYLLQNSS